MGLNWTILGGSVLPFATGNVTVAASADNARPSNAAYVALWGNDSTGNGSRNRPYRTITFARTISATVICANGYVSRETINTCNLYGEGFVVFIGFLSGDVNFSNIQILNSNFNSAVRINCSMYNCFCNGNIILNSASYGQYSVVALYASFNQTFGQNPTVNNFTFYNGTPSLITAFYTLLTNLGTSSIFHGGVAGYTFYLSTALADYNLFYNCNFYFNRSVAFSGTIANGVNTITGLSSTLTIGVGDSISGTGLTNAIVTSILSLTSVQISVNASASSTNTYTFTRTQKNFSVTGNGTTTNGSNIVTAFSSTMNLAVGNTVTGTGIPGGATIAEILSTTSFRLSANATASGTVSITSVLTIAGLRWENYNAYRAVVSSVNLQYSNIADPLFNSPANFDFTLQSSSPAKNMSPTGDYIGARGVATRLKFRTTEASGDWKNSAATNATVTDDLLRMTSNAANTVIESNVIDLGASNVLGRINLDHLPADRNGAVIAVDSDLSTSGISAGSNVLTAEVPYQVVGGNITWNGQTISNGGCFTAISGQISFSVASGSPQCYALQQYPSLRVVEMRGSNVSSGDVASQTYYKYKIGIPATVNRVGNVSGGAISRGNGDPSFDQTSANIFTVSFRYIQFRTTVQYNDLNS